MCGYHLAAKSEPAKWACEVCTYQNVGSRTICEMCGSKNPTSATTPSATGSRTAAKASSKFTLEKITDCVYKIVEDDRYASKF